MLKYSRIARGVDGYGLAEEYQSIIRPSSSQSVFRHNA